MSVDQFRTAMRQSVLVTRVEGTCVTSSAAPLNSYFACMSLLRRPLPPGGFCQYMLQCEAFPRLYERNDFPTVRSLSPMSRHLFGNILRSWYWPQILVVSYQNSFGMICHWGSQLMGEAHKVLHRFFNSNFFHQKGSEAKMFADTVKVITYFLARIANDGI